MSSEISKLAGTTEVSGEIVERQKEIIEQNSQILNELIKLNALLSNYTSNSNNVSNEDVLSVLGL